MVRSIIDIIRYYNALSLDLTIAIDSLRQIELSIVFRESLYKAIYSFKA